MKMSQDMVSSGKRVVTGTMEPVAKYKMRVDVDNLGFIMDVLAGLYEDPVLAVVREYSTNARDANIDAGNEGKAIIITTPTTINPVFSVTDSGPGMDMDDIKNIYSGYGISSKRDSNDVNGCLGLGSKAALGYGQSFVVTSVKDENRIVVEVVREDDGGATQSVISSSRVSGVPNGTTVSVPVASSDVPRFRNSVNDFFFWWEQDQVLINGKSPSGGLHYGNWFVPYSEDGKSGALVPPKGLEVDECPSFLELPKYSWGLPSVNSYMVMGGVAYPALDPIGLAGVGSPPNKRILSSGLYARPRTALTGSSIRGWVSFVGIGDLSFAPSREGLKDTPSNRQRGVESSKDIENGYVSSKVARKKLVDQLFEHMSEKEEREVSILKRLALANWVWWAMGDEPPDTPTTKPVRAMLGRDGSVAIGKLVEIFKDKTLDMLYDGDLCADDRSRTQWLVSGKGKPSVGLESAVGVYLEILSSALPLAATDSPQEILSYDLPTLVVHDGASGLAPRSPIALDAKSMLEEKNKDRVVFYTDATRHEAEKIFGPSAAYISWREVKKEVSLWRSENNVSVPASSSPPKKDKMTYSVVAGMGPSFSAMRVEDRLFSGSEKNVVYLSRSAYQGNSVVTAFGDRDGTIGQHSNAYSRMIARVLFESYINDEDYHFIVVRKPFSEKKEKELKENIPSAISIEEFMKNVFIPDARKKFEEFIEGRISEENWENSSLEDRSLLLLSSMYFSSGSIEDQNKQLGNSIDKDSVVVFYQSYVDPARAIMGQSHLPFIAREMTRLGVDEGLILDSEIRNEFSRAKRSSVFYDHLMEIVAVNSNTNKLMSGSRYVTPVDKFAMAIASNESVVVEEFKKLKVYGKPVLPEGKLSVPLKSDIFEIDPKRYPMVPFFESGYSNLSGADSQASRDALGALVDYINTMYVNSVEETD